MNGGWEFSDAGGEWTYSVPTDSYSERIAALQTTSEATYNPWLRDVATWLESKGPQYDGEPLLDFDLALRVRVGSLFGRLFVELGGPNPSIRGRLSVGGGEIRVGGDLAGELSPVAAVRLRDGPYFLEGNTAGRVAVGVGASLQLADSSGPIAVAEALAFVTPIEGTIGVAASARVATIGVVSEANVGWGRGAQLLATDLAGDLSQAVTGLATFPYRYSAAFDLR